jgi:serine protease Do
MTITVDKPYHENRGLAQPIERKMRLVSVLGKLFFLPAIVMLVAFSSCVVPLPTATPTPTDVPKPTPIDPAWTPPSVQPVQVPPDLSTLVAQVKPSVVSINVKLTSTNIFGLTTSQEGAGSGWIIDSGGLIVTNNHVVTGAQNIEVTLDDGRVFPASRVVADPVSDLAVVKIDAAGLPAAKIGDSSQMQVGMMVAAIGNALGQGLSMTAGWVSRLNASITISPMNETLYDLIETSAPINPGNSGGPLVNSAAQVIGITNAKLIATGVQSIGYAISINDAMPIIQQLIRTGYVVRPYFGVALETVDAGIATVYGLSVDSGALITDIAANSPASRAGLQAGDVIVQVGVTTVASASEAANALEASQIGQVVRITYWRKDTRHTADVTPTQNPQL